jgi:hypothetical protein
MGQLYYRPFSKKTRLKKKKTKLSTIRNFDISLLTLIFHYISRFVPLTDQTTTRWATPPPTPPKAPGGLLAVAEDR